MKLWVGICICFYCYGAWANCTSGLFAQSTRDTLRTTFTAGATAALSKNNKISPYVHVRSDQIFGKVHQMIVGAERLVQIQTWRFQPHSKPALYFADAVQKLIQKRRRQKAKKPVHIWLMINLISANATTKKQQMQRFVTKHDLQHPEVVLHFGYFKRRLLGANHAKTVTVDHKVALISGANFSKNYNGSGFFDLAFEFSGDVVRYIDRDFYQIWISYIKSGTPPDTWKQRNSTQRHGCLPILLTRSKAFPDPSSTPTKNSMNHTFLKTVASAKKTVEIFTPSLNVKSFMNEILAAVMRGVRVKIILNKGYVADLQNLPTRGGSNRQSVKRLHHALLKVLKPKEICERLQIRWYSDDGREPTLGSGPPTNHAKMMIVDDRVSFVGSANMDNQSWVNSREIALFIDSSRHAKQWQQDVFYPNFEKAKPVSQCNYAF